MRILLAVEPVDFRKGIDGLAALCRQTLSSDPLSGTLFVFCSRRSNSSWDEWRSLQSVRRINDVSRRCARWPPHSGRTTSASSSTCCLVAKPRRPTRSVELPHRSRSRCPRPAGLRKVTVATPLAAIPGRVDPGPSSYPAKLDPLQLRHRCLRTPILCCSTGM
jgi:hypothetical protein